MEAKDNIEQAVHLLQKELTKIEQEYHSKTSAIKTSISILRGGSSNGAVSTQKGVQTITLIGTSRKQRVIEALKTRGRFLHNREIATALSQSDEEKNFDNLKKKVSTSLSILQTDGKVVNYKPGSNKKEVYWGIPEWLTEHGEIRTGREFKTNEEKELFE